MTHIRHTSAQNQPSTHNIRIKTGLNGLKVQGHEIYLLNSSLGEKLSISKEKCLVIELGLFEIEFVIKATCHLRKFLDSQFTKVVFGTQHEKLENQMSLWHVMDKLSGL